MKKSVLLLLPLVFLPFPVSTQADILLNQHIIRQDVGGACSVVAADYDLDGDIDLALTASSAGALLWLENNGSQVFTQHSITATFTGARSLFGIDMDLDGDTDLVATAPGLNRLSWFGNDGHGNFTEHVIEGGWTRPSWAVAGDIDRDGDMDVAMAACDMNQAGWFENNGQGVFTSHVVKSGWTKANCIIITDLDKDGDNDFVGCAKAGNIIIFKNNGQQEFTETEVCSGWGAPSSVSAGDLDGDGDIDLAATSCGNGDQIAWFINQGNDRFNKVILKSNYDGSRQCEIVDLDHDGDLDILSIAWVSSFVTLWENEGGGEFREYQFCTDAYDMLKLAIVDLDGDNDLDIAGACYGDNEVRWWENVNEFLAAGIENEDQSGHHEVTVEFHDNSRGRPDISQWAWDFDSDGIIDSNESDPVHSFSQPGYYTVTLTVSNGVLSNSMVRENMVRVFDGNSALEFNGLDSYLEATPKSAQTLSSGFGFEAWIKPFSYGEADAGHLLQKDKVKIFLYETGALVPNNQCLALFMTHDNGTISKVCTAAGSIRLNEWQHVYAGYDAATSTVSVYINGINKLLTVSVAPVGALNNAGNKPFIIGNTDIRARTFDGVLEEIRIWDHALSQADIQGRMNSSLNGQEAGLIGYWRLDEGSGLTASDFTMLNTVTGRNFLWAQGKNFTASGMDEAGIGTTDQLSINPNPFTDQTVFTITTDQPQQVIGEILDMTGKVVYRFAGFATRPSETYRLVWNASDQNGNTLPPGLYIGRFTLGQEYRQIKLVKN